MVEIGGVVMPIPDSDPADRMGRVVGRKTRLPVTDFVTGLIVSSAKAHHEGNLDQVLTDGQMLAMVREEFSHDPDTIAYVESGSQSYGNRFSYFRRQYNCGTMSRHIPRVYVAFQFNASKLPIYMRGIVTSQIAWRQMDKFGIEDPRWPRRKGRGK